MADYRAMARAAAQKHGIDPDRFERQIGQESGYDEAVISGRRKSSAGAEGIAQIMREYHPGVEPLDPAAALDYAAKWMSDLLKKYRGDWAYALAEYNGGTEAVQRLLRGRPFEETSQYLSAILGPSTAYAAELEPTEGGDTPAAPAPAGDSLIKRLADLVGRETRALAPASGRGLPPPPAAPVTSYETRALAAAAGSRPLQTTYNPVTSYETRALAAAAGSRPLQTTYKSKTPAILDRQYVAAPTEEQKRQGQPGTLTRVIIYEDGATLTFQWDPVTEVWEQTGFETDAAISRSYLDRQEAARRAAIEERRAAESRAPNVISAPSAPKIVIIDPNGNIVDKDNPAYVRPTLESGGRLYQYDPTTNRATRVEGIEEQRGELQIALENHHNTIAYIQRMWESGKMKPAEANAHIQAINRNTQAILQGTTPWAMQQAARADKRAREQTAGALLTSRANLQSGIANSLMSSAMGLAQRAMMPAGQTSIGFDPASLYAASGGLADQAGGAAISKMAETLLAEAQGGVEDAPFPPVDLTAPPTDGDAANTILRPGDQRILGRYRG